MQRRSFIAGALATTASAVGTNPVKAVGKMLGPEDFVLVVDGIDHAEGLAIMRDGRLVFSSRNAVATIRHSDGRSTSHGVPIAPCGVALDNSDRVIIANMGLLSNRPGPLQRFDPMSGKVETLASEIGGRLLVASNNPVVARDGTIYCTHSAWGNVRTIGKVAPEGFVYAVDKGGNVAIVASGIRAANGCCLDRDERYLYVSSTAEGRVMRFRRNSDGTLGPRQDYGPVLGHVVPGQRIDQIRALSPVERGQLGYADGVAFDAFGNLWVTLPFANKLVAITPEGRKVDVAHDPAGKRIGMPTNIAWGDGGRTLFVVSRGIGAIVRAGFSRSLGQL